MLRNFFEFYLYPTQLPLTAISALWLRRSTAFRWLQQPIGRHLMIDVVEQVIERHQEVKNEGISEPSASSLPSSISRITLSPSWRSTRKKSTSFSGSIFCRNSASGWTSGISLPLINVRV